ncbi:GNAT family N-acetyltransferase [Pseudoduganella chitinolytica]|uniref:N-acetyltransferase n=1 Tax=Pseudoduganella chitinolytica TaxID=34070 RepID=A0ABY8B817_9BURK|nr:N-acetyltransferase [Pseudoduganella chitinolytica]WEF31173.1 N-acetyltransferase [Pseudoduganella chitinolytica]
MELTLAAQAIRPYRAEDFPAVAAVYDAAKLDEFQFEPTRFTLLPLAQDKERLAAFAQCDAIVYTCYGAIVGFAASSEDTLRALFVAPTCRGKGVGRSLLQAMLARLPGDVRLNVAASNHVAQAMYRGAGFEPTGTVEQAYNGLPVLYTTMSLARGQGA